MLTIHGEICGQRGILEVDRVDYTAWLYLSYSSGISQFPLPSTLTILRLQRSTQ